MNLSVFLQNFFVWAKKSNAPASQFQCESYVVHFHHLSVRLTNPLAKIVRDLALVMHFAKELL